MLDKVIRWGLALGATTRLVRLGAVDTFPPIVILRKRIADRYGDDHWATYLSTCPWCQAPYIAAATITTMYLWGDKPWWRTTAATLTLAHTSAWLTNATDH